VWRSLAAMHLYPQGLVGTFATEAFGVSGCGMFTIEDPTLARGPHSRSSAGLRVTTHPYAQVSRQEAGRAFVGTHRLPLRKPLILRDAWEGRFQEVAAAASRDGDRMSALSSATPRIASRVGSQDRGPWVRAHRVRDRHLRLADERRVLLMTHLDWIASVRFPGTRA